MVHACTYWRYFSKSNGVIADTAPRGENALLPGRGTSMTPPARRDARVEGRARLGSPVGRLGRYECNVDGTNDDDITGLVFIELLDDEDEVPMILSIEKPGFDDDDELELADFSSFSIASNFFI